MATARVVFRMTDGEAETTFRKIRWTETDGEAVCPHCGGLDPYSARRPSGLLRFRCKAFHHVSGPYLLRYAQEAS